MLNDWIVVLLIVGCVVSMFVFELVVDFVLFGSDVLVLVLLGVVVGCLI